MSHDPEVPPSLRVEDPLERAPAEDREALRAALTALTERIGAVPLPDAETREDTGFTLVWRLPDGVIELTAPGGELCWWTDGALFAEHDVRALNSGYSVVPGPDSPEAVYGGTLIPRFRTWLARHEELTTLRDQILKELRKTTDQREFMRHLMGQVTKKLGDGR